MTIDPSQGTRFILGSTYPYARHSCSCNPTSSGVLNARYISRYDCTRIMLPLVPSAGLSTRCHLKVGRRLMIDGWLSVRKANVKAEDTASWSTIRRTFRYQSRICTLSSYMLDGRLSPIWLRWRRASNISKHRVIHPHRVVMYSVTRLALDVISAGRVALPAHILSRSRLCVC